MTAVKETDSIIGGWMYPSAPCWPKLSLVQKYKGMKQLCGEFLRFVEETKEDGSCIELMTEAYYGYGGYSEEYVEEFRNSVEQPFCTISGRSDSGVMRMLDEASGDLQRNTIQKIVNFCKDNQLGADINIEGLSTFSQEQCEKHAVFLNELGIALKQENIIYRVVTVAEDGQLYHGNWKNDLLRDVTCSYIICMQYDRMYDMGKTGITPIQFLRDTTENMKLSLGDSWKTKYVCGLPNYGYKAYADNIWGVELLTRGQLKRYEGVDVLPTTRDADSHELVWEQQGKIRNGSVKKIHIFYSDQEALDYKARVVMSMGVNKFCLWHAFGPMDLNDDIFDNHYFSDDVVQEIQSMDNTQPPTEPEQPEIPEVPEVPEIPEIPTEPKCKNKKCKCDPCKCKKCDDNCKCCKEDKPQPPIEPVVLKILHVEGIKISKTNQVNQIIKYIKKVTDMEEITYLLEYKK